MAGSESTVAGTEYGYTSERKLPISPVTPDHQAFAEDAVPYLDSTPVRPNLEMAGSSQTPQGSPQNCLVSRLPINQQNCLPILSV